MKRITALELRYIVDELEALRGLRIGNIYHSDDEIRIFVDDNILLISPYKFYLTKKVGKKELSDFVLFLRRYLKNKSIERIDYHGLSVEMITNENILIIEFAPSFNCILCDRSYNIIMPLNADKRNNIMPKMKYIIPQDEALEIREKRPQVVYKNKRVFDAVPFDMDIYKKMDKKYFDSFNEALDYFFSKFRPKAKKRLKRKRKKLR